MKISRRGFGVTAAVMAALGAGALGYRHILGPWYAPTPYDDLLHQIVDRQPAALLGKTAVKTMPHFEVASLAARLRGPGFALSRRARGDAANGRVVEAGGWIVPESVALYSALAAEVG
jgi:hypothetical protein